MRFLTLTRQGRFFNPSRASPLDIVVRENYQRRRRAFFDKQPAVAISTGYCTESNLIRGKLKKSISILFHGQEWERYCCFIAMIFDETELIAQLYNSALTFATLPESVMAPPTFSSPVSPLNAARRSKGKTLDTPVERGRGALFFTDIGLFFFFSSFLNPLTKYFFIYLVPVFDARQVADAMQIEFENLDGIFPRFSGEVPNGSCVAVGHSVSTYFGKKEDEERSGAKVNLVTNVLFVVVFGTPSI